MRPRRGGRRRRRRRPRREGRRRPRRGAGVNPSSTSVTPQHRHHHHHQYLSASAKSETCKWYCHGGHVGKSFSEDCQSSTFNFFPIKSLKQLYLIADEAISVNSMQNKKIDPKSVAFQVIAPLTCGAAGWQRPAATTWWLTTSFLPRSSNSRRQKVGHRYSNQILATIIFVASLWGKACFRCAVGARIWAGEYFLEKERNMIL